MNNKFFYTAFGMNICSEIEIQMLTPQQEPLKIDVTIQYADLSEVNDTLKENHYLIVEPQKIYFYVNTLGGFLITNGNLIQVDKLAEAPTGLVEVYLLGSCFGAIIHQKRLFPLHGSCITNGETAILFTGDSGAGKSTLASEFLSHGWKLITDDVSVITGIEEGRPMVQSSYPSQKLWEDTKHRYDRQEETYSLFQAHRREKFGIRVNNYYEGSAPLKKIVRLIPTDTEWKVVPIDGFAKVHQLLYNTYRTHFVVEDDRQLLFQRCVSLSSQIEMYAAFRSTSAFSSSAIFDYLTNK